MIDIGKLCLLWAKTRAYYSKNLKIICLKTYSFGSPVFKDYKYIVISKTYISSFVRFLLLSTCTVRMSEGTFCRVEIHFVFFSI